MDLPNNEKSKSFVSPSQPSLTIYATKKVSALTGHLSCLTIHLPDQRKEPKPLNTLHIGEKGIPEVKCQYFAWKAT